METKVFFPLSGSFLVGLVWLDDFVHPSPRLEPECLILSTENPQALVIPAGYANGFRALQPASKLLIMSDRSLEDAEKITYDKNQWMNWEQNVCDR